MYGQLVIENTVSGVLAGNSSKEVLIKACGAMPCTEAHVTTKWQGSSSA